jgi:hypothetical protein
MSAVRLLPESSLATSLTRIPWIVAIAIAAATCTDISRPLSPSPGIDSPGSVPSTAKLTVAVQIRTAARPIQDAAVRHDGQISYTDASGEATLLVPRGQETIVDVSAAGYESLGASGVLANDERWTFYLAPEVEP